MPLPLIPFTLTLLGVKWLRSARTNLLAVHDQLTEGLPGEALNFLVENLSVLRKGEVVEKALGMSVRTYQRRQETGNTPLSSEQSARLWKFAEILAQAAAVFGSREEAERWLNEPALGLDQRRPIDLLATPAGVALVEEHLGRLRYSVYA
jgi:putative toxin-antitoxin system antitoxin component (TIGR02293 family)